MLLPAEVDFLKDREASPERMNRAMEYFIARLRALEAIQPEFQSEIERLRSVGLVKVAEGLVPVLEAAREIEETLQDLKDQWTGDLLPAQVAQNAANAVAALLADYRARWLGAHAAPPTVDEFGDPVAEGAMYWDSTLNAMRVLGDADWLDVSSIATDAAAAVAARDVAIAKAAEALAAADTAVAAAAGAAAAVLATVTAARDATIAARDVTLAARDITTGARDAAIAAKNAAEGFAASIDPESFAPAAHGHDASEITGLNQGGAELRRLGVAGRYFPHDAVATVAPSAVALPANRIYFVPFSTPGTYDAIAFGVATGAGNARVAIFGADTDAFPGAVIEQSASISVATTGDKVVLLAAPRTLAVGDRWWLALLLNDAPQIYAQLSAASRAARIFGSAAATTILPLPPTFLQGFGAFVDLTAQAPADFVPGTYCPFLTLRSA